MLKIYHAPHTRGIRPIWLCEELGIPYRVEHIDFSADYRATPEWRTKHPVGKLPVMEDGGVRMFESGAMVQYLLDRNPPHAHDVATKLHPDVDHPDYAHYLQWLWYGEATLSRPLGEIVNHGREFPGEARIDAVVQEMTERAVACLDAVGEHLAEREYLVAQCFTAADIMVGYGIYLATLLIPERVPESITPYWDRLKARPACSTALSA